MPTDTLRAEPRNFSPMFKILAVLCGGFITGTLWRIRGESGYGGMIGMFAVATALTLFLFSLYRGRKKLSYTMLPVTVVFAAYTVNGWGTINMQMGGFTRSTITYLGESSSLVGQINPWSGLCMMLIMGFGWLALFAFLIGSFFSHKRYYLRQMLFSLVLLEAVTYLAKATVSHVFLRWIVPDAVNLFRDGLAQQGINATPYSAYMQHFSDDTWAKTIHFGRNYFTSIALVSAFFAAIAVLLYIRFWLKDKRGFRIALAVDCIMALSITLANVGMVAGEEGSLFPRDFLEEWFQYNYHWSHWEYFTGFFLGIGVTALLMCLSRKNLAQSDAVEAIVPPLGGWPGYLYHALFTLFAMLGFTTLYPLIDRVGHEEASFQIGSTLGSRVTVVLAAVLLLAFWLYLMRKNILIGALKQPFTVSCGAFCCVTTLVYYILHQVSYGFTGSGNYLQGTLNSVQRLMLLSFAVVCISYCMLLQVQKKQLRPASE